MISAAGKADESEQDTTVGQNQENPTGAVPAPEEAKPAQQTAQQAAPGTTPAEGSSTYGGGGAGGGGAKPVDPCPGIDLGVDAELPNDDKEPDPILLETAVGQASAEALKPVAAATDELYSKDSAKETARKALETAYAKAAAKAANGNPAGALRAKYNLAEKKFNRAATDMSDRLKLWINERLEGTNPAKKAPIKDILLAAQQVEARVESRLGPREIKRDKSAETAKQWQKAYADWSKPADVMTALIGEYIDKIDKLNADINTNTNADQAIYTFWFEVAPKHLQLSPQSVSEATAPGSTDLGKALGNAWAKYWKSGRDRGDGSVFLLEPTAADTLTKQRKDVLACWSKAATEQAKREAAFKLRPDDAATLKARRDALLQGRPAAVKALLEDPVP